LKNVKEAIQVFLVEQNVNYLTVTGRIKTFDSFQEKIERKKYLRPFAENEDFIGIRVIVYYPKDMQTVQEIIETEFDLQNKVDKMSELDVNQFGYRSYHSVVRIKSEWLAAPNYRGLEDLKIEFQVRTILMHAWAEISHKFSYKTKNQIPTQELERQLFLLSASFENSDRQLQVLRDDIEKYKDDIKLNVEVTQKVPESTRLNFDSLSALFDYYLPGYPSNQKKALKILHRMIEKEVSINQVEELLKKILPLVGKINRDIFPNNDLKLTQGTILAYADDIFNTPTINPRYSETRRRVIEKYRSK
jgi:ppGpp synthetase/RelA/SpoT-type nucleotidyltranferase